MVALFHSSSFLIPKPLAIFDQWEELIKYWAVESIQRKSAKNKSSHAKNKYNHTTGRKNFAQLRALQKAGGASTPTRATMFKICYAKKKKSIINEKTKEVMTLDRGDIATSSNLV
uniref:Uncharacterized protein n=1 Tax=Cannabis sativa TaxID=3483 RepID=A0A803P504_CANSA